MLGPQWGFLPEFISLERGKEREEVWREGEFVSYTKCPDFAEFGAGMARLQHCCTSV